MIHKTAKTLLLLVFVGLCQLGLAQQALIDRLAPEPEQAEYRPIPPPPAPTDTEHAFEQRTPVPVDTEATPESRFYDEAAVKADTYRPIPQPPIDEKVEEGQTPSKTPLPRVAVPAGSDDEKVKAPLRAIPPPPVSKDH